jgi:hypothetical protein
MNGYPRQSGKNVKKARPPRQKVPILIIEGDVRSIRNSGSADARSPEVPDATQTWYSDPLPTTMTPIAMTSAKKRKANRNNAKKSCGPKTAAGKVRSRMNALKHGLDAETLILEGEDEAAYRRRHEAWTAVGPPRDGLEATLIDQAVRLSWRLDRANRACAAHLAERIQLLQSPEYRKQQAEAAAALAAEIGEQLLAGPPPPKYNLAKIHAKLVRMRKGFWAPFTPIFDLPSTQARMALKRLGKPTPPGDPAHPQRLLRDLESTAAGCQWLLDRWTALRTALETNGRWQPDERLCATRLLAKLPADALDDPMVQTIYQCCFVLDGNEPRVLDDQAKEMADREFQYFLERMAGRTWPSQKPAGHEEARDRLLALMYEIVARLQVRAAMHATRAELAVVTDRLAFDGSPAERRIERLRSRLSGSLMRTINLLMAARRRPDTAILRPDRAETLDASPREDVNCETVRNEANTDAEAAGEPMVGWVQPTGCELRPSAGCTHPASSPNRSVKVVATSVESMSCETVRNEANAAYSAVDAKPRSVADAGEGTGGRGDEPGVVAITRPPPCGPTDLFPSSGGGARIGGASTGPTQPVPRGHP